MTRLTALLVLAALLPATTPSRAAETGVSDAAIRAAVRRSLPYIQKHGVWWIENKKCTSCHRVTFMVWSLIEADRRGFAVDRQKLDGWIDWSLNKPDNNSPDTRAQIILGFQPAANSKSRRNRLAELAKQLAASQQKDGSWKPGGQLPSQKRPRSETTEVSTMWNAAALVAARAKSPVPKKAAAFLASAKPGKSTEWLVARLALEQRRGHADAVAAWTRQLLARQRDDGGWGWLSAEHSDALATGMSLYALVSSGTPRKQAAVQKAIRFLLKTQQSDGSWRVNGTKAKKRSKPQETSNYWGTTWATIGLLQTLPVSKERSRRLDRNKLLIYRDARGRVRPVKSTDDWQKRRAAVLKGMQQVMGPLPGKKKRCPLDVKVVKETDCGSYVRRFITYASEPGSRVPAYLLIPKRLLKGGKRAPAVLCLHPTDNKIGHKVVVGLGGRPNRQYAQELAQRGYVTLAPSYPLLANYQPDLKRLGYRSGTMKAIWDNIRGIDLLESLPFVKTGGVGAIGHSLGGHNAVYTAVFDDRIKAVVSSCGLDSYLDYKDGNIKGWTSTRYMPRLLEYKDRLAEIPFDFHEMIAALAPRHCFISAPLHDSNFQWKSVDKVAKAASQVYRLYGVPERLQVKHPDCNHDFPKAMRQHAYRLFDAVLR